MVAVKNAASMAVATAANHKASRRPNEDSAFNEKLTWRAGK